VKTIWKDGVKKQLSEYRKKTARQKYAKHDGYSAFKEAIFVSRSLALDSLVRHSLHFDCRRRNMRVRQCHPWQISSLGVR
jgi:hypothetical protein